MLEELKRKKLSWSELFYMAKEIYGQNKKTAFLVSLVVLTPLYIFQSWVLNQALMGLGGAYTTEMIAEKILENEGMFPYFIFTLVSALVSLVVTPLATVAIIHGTEKIIKNEVTTPKENILFSFSQAASVVFTEFLAAAVTFGIVFVAILLIFVVGIIPILGVLLAIGIFLVMFGALMYLETCWCFTEQVVAIQGDIGTRALQGSLWAVKPYFWETFALLLVMNVVVQGINWLGNFILNSMFYASSVPVYFGASVIWNFVFHGIVTGFSMTFLTILFCNRIWQRGNTAFSNEMEDVVNTWHRLEENTGSQETETVSLEKEETEEGKAVSLEKGEAEEGKALSL